jgi:hypothetical protein
MLYKNMKAKIKETTILPFLYGCGTRSLVLRDKYRLGNFRGQDAEENLKDFFEQ